MSGNGSDPLLTDDWVADPWDDAASLPSDALETTPPGLDFLRGPMRNLVIILVATLLLMGAGGLWVVRQLSPGGAPGVAVNFTVNEGDTLDAVVNRLDAQGDRKSTRLNSSH